MAETHKRSSQPISLSYDPNTDTLYLTFGNLKGSIARDVGKGILIQHNAKTKRPVGAIIHDFEQRFSGKTHPCRIPFVSAILQPT